MRSCRDFSHKKKELQIKDLDLTNMYQTLTEIPLLIRQTNTKCDDFLVPCQFK